MFLYKKKIFVAYKTYAKKAKKNQMALLFVLHKKSHNYCSFFLKKKYQA